MTTSRSIALLVVVLTLLGACRTGSRAPAFASAQDAIDPPLWLDGMNPHLLTDLVSPEVVVEVDWVDGSSPDPTAIEAVASALERHGDRSVRIVLDDRIPPDEFERLSGREDLDRLAARWFDADSAPRDRSEPMWVLYLPSSESLYGEGYPGMADTVRLARRGRPARNVPVILIFAEGIRRDAMLWVTASKVERATLVHELGHHLGLVSNPAHAQPDHPSHCTKAGCVMNQPGIGATLRNAPAALFSGRIPSEYCRRCRADIALAREIWYAREGNR